MVSRAIVLPVLLAVSAWGQLTFTVPVADRSDSGSPLEISGTISFTESEQGTSIALSTQYEVTARNLSPKVIILLIASMDGAAPHSKGRHRVLQFDNLFHEGFAPGESFVLARESPEERGPTCCVGTLDADEPHGEIRVQYVRFSDGSTFGDESVAADILEVESMLLERLRGLDTARNDKEFLRTLREKMRHQEADAFLESIRSVQRTQGTAAARKQVRAGLEHADRHLTELMTAQAVAR